MAQYKVVPWLNRKEVRKVYQELFSDDILQQKHAVGRIDVWKSRQVHRLPLALESTAAFICADVEWQRSPVAQDDTHLRSLYSIALLRFVNHITEKGQNRPFARPVHVLAAEVGVPEWIVELRHAATHGSLPSLGLLRAASRWALHWLKEEFWAVQVEGPSRPATPEAPSGTDHQDTVRDMLVAFQQQRFQQQDKDRETAGKLDNQLILDLEQACTDHREQVLGSLLEDGYLIATADQLTSMHVSHTDLINSKGLSLPSQMMTFWRPLFRLLQRCDLAMTFLLRLLSEVVEGASLRNRQLLGWIYTMVDHNNPRKKQLGKESLFKTSFSLPYRHLLDVCANIISPYTPRLVNLILSRMSPTDISDNKKKQLKQIIATFFNDGDDGDTDGNTVYMDTSDVMTTKDTDAIALEDKVKAISDLPSTAEDQPWKRCTGVTNWAGTPLGVLPGQVVGYRTLELSRDGDSNDETMAEDDIEITAGACCEPGDVPGNKGTSDLASGQWNRAVLEEIKANISIL